MARYSAPLADIRFALYDVLDVESLFKRLPGFETATRDVLDAVLDEAAKFTEQVLAPLNQTGDQEGCHFDAATASVKAPAGFKKAYEQHVLPELMLRYNPIWKEMNDDRRVSAVLEDNHA